MSTAKKYLDRHKELLTRRQYWLDLWQLCGEYVHTMKQSFMATQTPGTFLNKDLFDATGRKANRKMASSLIGMMWQNGGRSMRLNPVRSLPKSKEIQDYFEKISQITAEAFDDPAAGFDLALEEYFIDQGAFGTSGVGTFDGGDESDLKFKAFGVQNISIDEGENGFVNTIYIEVELTVRQMLERYGLSVLSEKTRKAATDGRLDTKVKVLHAIEPRLAIDPRRANNRNMPISSTHIEIETKHILRESGYQEMPINIARFYKVHNEIYGRSSGMDALSDILELNSVREARLLAQEKALDPPLGVYSDATLGNNKIDTSAGSINVVNHQGRVANAPPVFPLFTVGDIREADKQIEELKISITEHFNIDKLLDFNNETQMTLGEAQMRSRIRGESLGSLFTRQIKELFTPTINRAVALLYRKGKLGFLPGTPEAMAAEASGEEVLIIPEPVAKLIAQGKEFYDVKYFTPAARMMEAEEAEGILRTWEFAISVSQTRPEVMDVLDADESVRRLGFIFGAPTSIVVDNETVEKIRQIRMQQQQQQQQMQQMAQAAQVAKEATTAEKQHNEAQVA